MIWLWIVFQCHTVTSFILNDIHSCPHYSSVSSFLSHIGVNVHTSGTFGISDLDVTHDPKSSSCTVLKANYAKGSHSHTHDRPRGAQFFVTPSGFPHGATDVTLSYDVYFPSSFSWVKGGKLPGAYGHSTHCSGGRDSNHCISTRFMWRANGAGELYLYFPKGDQPNFDTWAKHQQAEIVTNDNYGVSIRSSRFVFTHNKWINLKQQIHLNSVHSSGHGNADGWIKVFVNHESAPIMTTQDAVLRKYDDVKIDGIFFSTFFGGHDDSWASAHDTYTLYKNFQISVGHH